MNLKEIVLAGALLLYGSSAFSQQDKLYFDIYSRFEGFFNIKLNNSSLKADSKEINFSFLYGIYSTCFDKVNDSTYRETVKNNFLWISKEETFDYLRGKDSCYTFVKYSAKGEKPREEKKALEGRTFNKKYKPLPELFDDFEKGLLKDSIHMIVNAVPYSIKVKSIEEEKNNIIYSCSLEGLVKREPGDIIIFPYPIELFAEKRAGGKIVPLRFCTKFLNVRSGNKTFIEGELRKK